LNCADSGGANGRAAIFGQKCPFDNGIAAPRASRQEQSRAPVNCFSLDK
jgi:hypothetical protein